MACPYCHENSHLPLISSLPDLLIYAYAFIVWIWRFSFFALDFLIFLFCLRFLVKHSSSVYSPSFAYAIITYFLTILLFLALFCFENYYWIFFVPLFSFIPGSATLLPVRAVFDEPLNSATIWIRAICPVEWRQGGQQEFGFCIVVFRDHFKWSSFQEGSGRYGGVHKISLSFKLGFDVFLSVIIC